MQYFIVGVIHQSEKNFFVDMTEHLHHPPSNHLNLKIISRKNKYNYVTFTLKCCEYKSFFFSFFV